MLDVLIGSATNVDMDRQRAIAGAPYRGTLRDETQKIVILEFLEA